MKVQGLAMALAAGAIGLSSAAAQANWSDDFSDGDTAGWSFFNHVGNAPGSTISAATNQLIIHDPNPFNPASSDLSVTGLITTETFDDVRVRATITPQGLQNTLAGPTATANNYVYLVAHSNIASGYVLAFDWGERDFQFVRVDNGVQHDPQGTHPESSTRFHDLDLGLSYVMEMTIIGNDLTGRLYHADGTSLIGEVTWNDTMYTSGYSGVGSVVNEWLGTGATTISAGFDNVSSVAIPEPASLALVGLGALLIFRKGRR